MGDLNTAPLGQGVGMGFFFYATSISFRWDGAAPAEQHVCTKTLSRMGPCAVRCSMFVQNSGPEQAFAPLGAICCRVGHLLTQTPPALTTKTTLLIYLLT